MEELAEIRKRTDVEIEAFVHGAMCISYSGRCTLSNHMSMRDANLVDVHNLVVGNTIFTTCHSVENVRASREKFLKNSPCLRLICL